MQTVPLSVDDEMKAVGDAFKVLIVDIMAKKGIATITTDALPLLLSAIGGLQSMGVDIRKVDNQVYLLRCIAEALEPAPVAA